MLFQSKYITNWVNAGLFIIALALSLHIPFSKDDWKDLTDPYDYLHQSKISLLDKEFYFPHKTDDFDPRPFTVPLFYKFCRADTDAIVQMQRTVLFLSGFFMITAMMLLFEKSGSKYLIMVSIYTLLSWWNVQGWATLVLSEALSTALLFCWLASFIFLYKKGTLRWLLLHLFILVLFAFTRDSWPYVMIAFYTGISGLCLVFKQPRLKNYILPLLFSVGIFFIQQAAARIGERSKLPVINTVVVRILPNHDYTQWFAEHGMPCADKLKQNFGGIDVVPVEGQHKLWALYSDTAYQPFLNWVVDKGQHTYTRFLLTHPSCLFLTNETPVQLKRIMSYNLFYINEARGDSIFLQNVFPLFNIGVVTVLCIISVMIFTQRKTTVLLVPVFLAVFTLANVLISYNADALEVERHLFITNVLVQLTGFGAVAAIWDSLAWRKKLRA